MQRGDNVPARDSSLIPTGEHVFDAVALGADVSTVTFPEGSVALILQVQGDGAFYEGQGNPDAAKNIEREASTIHNIPVNGRSSWKFLRKGASTVNLRLKLLTAS